MYLNMQHRQNWITQGYRPEFTHSVVSEKGRNEVVVKNTQETNGRAELVTSVRLSVNTQPNGRAQTTSEP